MARVVTRDPRRDARGDDARDSGRLQERRDGRCYVVATRGASRRVMKNVMMKDVTKVMTRDVARVVTRDLSRDVAKSVTSYETIDVTRSVVA